MPGQTTETAQRPQKSPESGREGETPAEAGFPGVNPDDRAALQREARQTNAPLQNMEVNAQVAKVDGHNAAINPNNNIERPPQAPPQPSNAEAWVEPPRQDTVYFNPYDWASYRSAARTAGQTIARLTAEEPETSKLWHAITNPLDYGLPRAYTLATDYVIGPVATATNWVINRGSDTVNGVANWVGSWF